MTPTSQSSAHESRFKRADAASYDPVADDFDRLTRRYSARPARWLLKLLDADPGSRVLDVGTGTGVVAESAQELGLHILGVDLSVGMLARARRNLADAAEETGAVSWMAADAEDLGALDDASVDAAISLYALLHLPRPEAALAALYRVLRPGGRLVLGVGSGPPRLTPAGAVDAVVRLFDRARIVAGRRLEAPALIHDLIRRRLPAEDSDGPAETRLVRRHGNRSRVVPALVRAAGFADVRVAWHSWRAELSSAADFWTLQTTFSSTARKRLPVAAPESVAALRAEFFERCRRVQARGGQLVYPHAALAVIARR